jgi:sigma-E factor negative regulatory protein RseC
MCDCCKSSGVCNSLAGGENMETEAVNTIGGKVGDRILLKISSKSLWKISFVLYMIPVIFLVSGAIVGQKIGENYFPSLDPELCSLLSGLLACALSFLIIRIFSKQVRDNKDYMPEIVKII